MQTTHAPPPTNATPRLPARLADVLAIVVLHSIGTAVIWHVIFFIAEQQLGYSRTANLTLGVVTGACYTVSAFASSGVIARLQRATRLSLRAILAALLAGSALLAAAPATLGEPGLWLFATLYSALTGMVWPAVEAFLAGGRSGRELRNASGRFNISWSSAVVLGSVLASPIVELAPAAILFGLAGVHLATIAVALRLPHDPPAAGHAAPVLPDADDRHAPSPALATRLLSVFRVLNFSSYTLTASLTPVLPHMLAGFDVPVAQRTALGGAWMLTRVLAFVLFERWHAWHASALTPVAAAALLLLGVTGAFASPHLAGPDAGLPILIAALAVLGAGAGVAYAGSIYYSVHAKAGDVDAGGKHEGFIGMGYTLGPALGFAIVALIA